MPDRAVYGPLTPADTAILNYRGPNNAGDKLNDIIGDWYGRKRVWARPAAAGAVLMPATAVPTSGNPVTVAGPFGVPDVPRCVNVISSVGAVTGITLNGLDEGGNPISEVLNSATGGGTASVNAYASLTSVILPVAAAQNVSVVTGALLGIGTRVIRKATLITYAVDGATTAVPASTIDRNVLSKNLLTVTPSGTSEYAIYILAETT